MIKRIIIYTKLYMQRSMGYVSILNTMMIMFLFLSDLKKYSIFISIEKYLIPICIGIIIGMVLFGYLEDRLGMFELENTISMDRSKQIEMIMKKLDEIERKIK